MAAVQIIRGDCRQILSQLEAGSIHCCVTSPPYWGFRDYGTATWEGGDPGCDHRKPRDKVAAAKGSTLEGGKKTTGHQQESWGDYCRKCGARRIDQQLGLEPTPEAYVSRMVEVFREVRRVLRDDGTLWLNLGDSYANNPASGRERIARVGDKNPGAHQKTPKGDWERPSGLKPKDLVGIPWRVAFALQADGWYLRSDIIWHKPNPMPESVTDRPTKAHEYLFLFAKGPSYYYDAEAIAEPSIDAVGTHRGGSLFKAAMGQKGDPKVAWHNHRGVESILSSGKRNKRSVWTVATEPYPEAHFATFPTALIEPCIKAGCPAGGTVLDPFGGSGTTGQVARQMGCNAVLIELNEAYCALAEKRLAQEVLPLEATA